MPLAQTQHLLPEGIKEIASPEIELLLCCARVNIPSATQDRVRQLLQSAINWTLFIELASIHGLLPLAHRHLGAMAPSAIPKDILVQLWIHHESTLHRNQIMADELLFILRALEAEGIPAIPFKGPALAVEAYGNLALREFGDLDILLRQQDVLRTCSLLERHGYTTDYDLTADAKLAFLQSKVHYCISMTHPDRKTNVELHWKTDVHAPVESTGEKPWWAGSEFASLSGTNIRSFTKEALLLVLFIHGGKHAWSSLGWLVDVAELMRKQPDLDWEWIVKKATQLKCRRRLAVGLHLATHLLDAPLPSRVRNELLTSIDIQKQARTILDTLLNTDANSRAATQSLMFNLSLVEENPWRRFTHIVNTLLAPSLSEWSRFRLPPWLSFLNIPFRLFRLLAKHARIELQKIRYYH